MSYQGNSNAYVAYKQQVALGTPATGAGGKVLRNAGGQGGQLTKANTASAEVRRDGMTSRGRHGSQRTNGSWDAELTVESMIDILEAILRDTWSPAPVVLTEADFTSITTTANSIVFAAGDPRAKGIAAGDVIRLSGSATAANNDRNLRVTLVDATTVHVAETLTVDADADADATLTVMRKLVQFRNGALVKRYYTVEEVDADIAKSEVMSDFVFTQIKISAQADGIVKVTITGQGAGAFATFEGAQCPSLTNPVETESTALAVADAFFQINGVDAVDLESWDLTIDIGGNAPATFGSGNQKYAPDVFTGAAQVSLNYTALRKDLQAVQDLLNETQYSFSALLVDDSDEPKEFLALFVGNSTLGSVTKSALSNQAGGRTVSVQVPAALIGKDIGGAGRDTCQVKFVTSLNE